MQRELLMGNSKVQKINTTSETKLIFYLPELKALRYMITTTVKLQLNTKEQYKY